ncbi:hypothetical protein [Demequina capsici]|uniref:Uncharacterized protein n=1 Tax=Demequina capsici TaxID=3075620 RepID=A0AA96F969_9MICO|nr:hypothetical protein [Demequina sp. OYTSA14]WNM25508.1 hypothetical protein RN606_05005 [Demequina sp. OYTSA14]
MAELTPEQFGRSIVGPVVAEFSLRLWNLASLIDRPGSTAMLFCARGGLRMLTAYERLTSALGLEAPVRAVPVMATRLATIRPAIAPAVRGERPLGPETAETLAREFGGFTTDRAVRALAGVPLDPGTPGADAPATPDGILAALAARGGAAARAELLLQSDRFARHLDGVLAGAEHAMFVDTGLNGTIVRIVPEGFPHLRVSQAQFARHVWTTASSGDIPAHGLIEHSRGYAPWRRRAAVLRYWQFFEWLFEPDLPSVSRFDERDGVIVSNLEQVEGWQERALPRDDEMFAGVLAYLDGLVGSSARRVLDDIPDAWRALERAIVWPDRAAARMLDIGVRYEDFGKNDQIAQWRAPTPLSALLRPGLWREGEVAEATGALRLPLLATIQLGYGLRSAGAFFQER